MVRSLGHDGTVRADRYVDDLRLADAISAAQKGDEAAFRIIYRAVHPRLLAYLRTLVGPADCEDVASEAWLQIARDLYRFHGDADRFRGWAARIARNRGLDHLRRLARRPAWNGDESELREIAAASGTAGEAIEAMATERALALIARLPQEQAEAVVLRVVMGLEASTAARVLGKRAGAVRTAAYRGLRRLAVLLGDTENAEDGEGAESAAGEGAADRGGAGSQDRVGGADGVAHADVQEDVR